jgi:uncharacterized NAD(P)/FAD-binding protein YdhS
MRNMKKIAIIGCGFSGTMTAVQLIKNADHPFELILIGDYKNFNTGIAYNPYSKKQLLNVVASKMSAFQDKPDDFTNWVSALNEFSGIDKGILANTYLPRYLFGQYLRNIWEEALQQIMAKRIQITIIDSLVLDMEVSHHEVTLVLDNEERITAQYCVIASGNNLPGNPDIENTKFFGSRNYFRNPWDTSAVRNHDSKAPILILGNGLTMVDTLVGLIENGFRNKIYTISPHGFTILPHRHPGIGYSAITEELHGKQNLNDIVLIVNKHIKLARKLGFTAEPIIDAIRPLTQQLWQNLTNGEKNIFMARLRHLWDAVRHRIPMNIHDQIRQLTEVGKLDQYAGKLMNITETEMYIKVLFFDVKQKLEKEMLVSAVINCTGPETDINKLEKSFLKNCLQKGIVVQDELKLGIMADPVNFETYNGLHERQRNLLAMGSLLKGVLWESTAVKELREQSEKVSEQLICKMQE